MKGHFYGTWYPLHANLSSQSRASSIVASELLQPHWRPTTVSAVPRDCPLLCLRSEPWELKVFAFFFFFWGINDKRQAAESDILLSRRFPFVYLSMIRMCKTRAVLSNSDLFKQWASFVFVDIRGSGTLRLASSQCHICLFKKNLNKKKNMFVSTGVH